MTRDDEVTLATLADVDYRLNAVRDALEQEAYSSAADYADEVADLLRALNERLVRRRIDAGTGSTS